jgi:hypothetical protein
MSIVRYLGNQFTLNGLPILREYRGLRFHQLPDREQRFLKMRTLRTILISAESHPNMKFEIFERLNTGSISLNAQELRNSVYRGPFNALLRELAKTPIFRTIIGTKNPRRRMVDEELILRFLSLKAHLGEYRTPLKRFLNNFMQEKRIAEEPEIGRLKADFHQTVGTVQHIFGRAGFRITDPQGHTIEPAVNRALFDSQMLASSWITMGMADVNVAAVRREYAALFGDETFMDAIQRATGDRARTLKRIRETVLAMRRAGVRAEVPVDLTR